MHKHVAGAPRPGKKRAQAQAACLDRAAPERAVLPQRGVDSYIKRKKTDPLESYVPAMLVAQDQLLSVPAAAAVDVQAARQLLRKGAFAGLRDNVRAVGEYAEPALGKDEAKARVTAFFRSLEAVDTALFLASRGDGAAPANLGTLVDSCNEALERVLDTVPDDAMAIGRQVVEAIQAVAPADAVLSAEEEASVKRLAGLL